MIFNFEKRSTDSDAVALCRDSSSETGLRRIVCHLGTTGGDSHRLVTRSLQGLFKEVSEMCELDSTV